MKKTGIFSLLLLLVTTAWAQPSPTVPAALKETKVSNAELLKWTFNGIGMIDFFPSIGMILLKILTFRL